MGKRVYGGILFMLFMLAGGLSLFLYYGIPVRDTHDVVAYNRLAKEAALHWEDVGKGRYGEVGASFCILDLDGEVLLISGEGAITQIAGALAGGYPIIDVEQNNKVLGRIIIAKSPETILVRYRSIALMITVGFLAAAVILCTGYSYYLNKRIIRPFQDMEKFALEVSRGNLDFPLKMDQNNLFGAFTESFDRMREQLLSAREREVQAGKNQKELVAALSHDIKTPVTSIKITSEYLLELVEQEAVRDKLSMIYQKTEQIENLVNNLFHSTLQDLEQMEVSASAHYSSVLTEAIRAADYKNKVKFSPVPECLICVDELRLMQIVSNIITNSYKYADTDIVMEASVADTYLQVSFRDFGAGVEEEELPLLCSRFYRGKNAAGLSGSGLGLYLCRKLVRQMQGDIYCTCQGGGFRVVLFMKLIG